MNLLSDHGSLWEPDESCRYWLPQEQNPYVHIQKHGHNSKGFTDVLKSSNVLQTGKILSILKYLISVSGKPLKTSLNFNK